MTHTHPGGCVAPPQCGFAHLPGCQPWSARPNRARHEVRQTFRPPSDTLALTWASLQALLSLLSIVSDPCASTQLHMRCLRPSPSNHFAMRSRPTTPGKRSHHPDGQPTVARTCPPPATSRRSTFSHTRPTPPQSWQSLALPHLDGQQWTPGRRRRTSNDAPHAVAAQDHLSQTFGGGRRWGCAARVNGHTSPRDEQNDIRSCCA